MKNVLHNKGWGADTNMAHAEPPTIPLVKETSTGKADGDNIKLKLRRYTMSSMPDIYDFIISLFDHVEPEEFLLFVRNFQMTLAATGTLEPAAKVQYLHTLVRGEALCQFDLLCSDVKKINHLRCGLSSQGFNMVFSR